MADKIVQGLSADASRIPSKWNRQTVADGDWLQKKTLAPLSARDVYLASAIDMSTSAWEKAVADEYERAIAAEQALDQKIEQETTNRIADVNEEETRAKNAETVLQNAITDETTRATSEESRIEGLIVQEQTRAQAAEGNLNTKIETETTNREEADRVLAEEIEGLKAATDVISVFGTYAQFVNGSADLHATDKDFIKVLADESRNNVQTYYQSTVTTDTTEPTTEDEEPVTTTTTSWAYVTALPPYYDTSTIDGKFNEISATVSSTYLSANGAVFGSTNIKVVPDANDPKITIETYPDVTFTTVTSVGFSGTNLSGATKHDTIDNLFGSAYSGAAASAWVSANSASLDIQPGYGLETGTNENGNKVIGIRQDHCDYAAYGLALGTYSTAQGDVNGPNAFAFGDYCYAHGANAFAAGCHSTAGKFAVAMGYYNVATGDYSLALGYNSTADRAYSVVIGQGLSGNGSITLGKFNEYVADAQFVIGDGRDQGYEVTARKNILVIKDDKVSAADFSAGNVSLSSLTNISAFGNGITNTVTFNLSAVKLSAGQGIGFKNDTNGVLSITAEGTTYNAGDYISTANKTIAVTGDLITSANAGSAASAWINTNKTKIAYSADFKGSNNVITGYGTSSFAGGISSISVGNTVFTGRDVKFSAGDNILFTTADNKLSINVYNNLSLGESESKRIFTLTTEEVIGADGPGIFIDNVPQTQVQLYNNKIYRNGKSTTWDKVISAGNGNFVSAANNQTLALASATTAITPGTMSNNIIYLV